MKIGELMELVNIGEGYTIEFKKSVDKALGKEMCAFANASGGKIVLGVTDDNKIKDFTLTNTIKSQIQDIAKNIDPSLVVKVEQVENVVVVFVPEGKEKPYQVGGEFYLRQGANSLKQKRDEVKALFQKENHISFERKISGFDLKKDFNSSSFESFRTKSRISKTLSLNHVMHNLELLTDGKPNNACALMFSNKITKFFLSADISCVLYQGTSKANMLDKKVFDLDFISNFENSVLFILRNIRTRADIVEMRRVENPEIPENALREALLNAMIHKDYFIEGRVLVEVFSDRVEIGNPGKLLFDKKELGNISILRNPIIADCMQRAGFVEKIGSGIGRIKELASNVKFEVSSNWFRTVFQRSSENAGEKLGERLGEKLGENKRKIVSLLREKNTISIVEISEKIGISTTAVENNIKFLKQKGLIKRVGHSKGGHWEVLK